MQKQKTRVIFRKWDNGDIIALFPDIGPASWVIKCLSYEHDGQHAEADYAGVMKVTTRATPPEYKALQQELEQIGYNIEITYRK